MDDILRELVPLMRKALAHFTKDVGNYNRLVEQPREEPIFGERGTRWWHGGGWDMIRTPAGVWMGWPIGKVVHPPFFGAIYQTAPAETIQSVADFGGWIAPAAMTSITRPPSSQIDVKAQAAGVGRGLQPPQLKAGVRVSARSG